MKMKGKKQKKMKEAPREALTVIHRQLTLFEGHICPGVRGKTTVNLKTSTVYCLLLTVVNYYLLFIVTVDSTDNYQGTNAGYSRLAPRKLPHVWSTSHFIVDVLFPTRAISRALRATDTGRSAADRMTSGMHALQNIYIPRHRHSGHSGPPTRERG